MSQQNIFYTSFSYIRKIYIKNLFIPSYTHIARNRYLLLLSNIFLKISILSYSSLFNI